MTDAQILRNLSLLSTSAARQLVEDPLLLACRGHADCLGPGASARPAQSAPVQTMTSCRERCRLIADRTDSACRALRRSVPRSAVGRRLAAELAVQSAASS